MKTTITKTVTLEMNGREAKWLMDFLIDPKNPDLQVAPSELEGENDIRMKIFNSLRNPVSG